MTYHYRAPERLENDWKSGRRTPPGEMISELRDDIDSVIGLLEAGTPLVPVQGRISDYKSWLAAGVAMDMAGDGHDVTVFSPQRTNRESAVDKLELFDAEYMEHPGRHDLCIWDEWLETVGRVDRSTCESIGCPFYVDSEADRVSRTEDALSAHAMTGGTALDTGTMRDMGSRSRQNMCPAQLYLEARSMEATDGAVNVATYAKAFEDAAIATDDPLGSDVVLLDEAHTVAASPDAVTDPVYPDSLVSAIETITDHLESSAEVWADRSAEELEGLANAIDHWADRSEESHVEPDEIFTATLDLGSAFDTLDTVDSRLMQDMRREMRRGNTRAVSLAAAPYTATQTVRSFLSSVKSYRDSDADFVHSLYQENGETVNRMAFRSVDESASIDDGCTPGEVFREWERRGTHEAISRRWGPILDRYIESLWNGRAVYSGGDLPGAPMMPLDRLREISGADRAVTLSATHNELSDPTRDDTRLRETRHELLCAPLYLRADGTDREDYDGSESVSPDTPWFRDLVRSAVEESGDEVAVVPINFSNREKWEGMPVVPLEDGDGERVPGVVPHSRGSIGEKGLEEKDVDTVLCGVQVQSPAPTALRLVRWWEMLAPRRDDPADVLEDSWRLLAQHAVSGTIQAGGRFRWDATNLVFERPGLLKLAGFDVREACPGDSGFAGAMCRILEKADGEWSDKRDAVRAARVVRYLEDTDGKAPTVRQSVQEYKRIYDEDDQPARRALWLADDRGKVSLDERNGDLRFKTDD